MAMVDYLLAAVERRLRVSSDKFRDANGEALFVAIRSVITDDRQVVNAIKEIERRRSEKIE
jgi:hypothetical protein